MGGIRKALLLFTLLASACTTLKTSPSPTASQPTSTLPITATPTPTYTHPSPTPIPTETPESVKVEESPTPTPIPEEPARTPTATPTQVILAEKDCTDVAAYYDDVTVPDGTHFDQGDQFVKTWRVSNAGTCTWGEGYSLVFASGTNMNGPLENPIPLAAPGSIIEISINLEAPARGGEYTGNWEFMNDRGERFGVGFGGHDKIWVQIAVGFVEPETDSHDGNATGDQEATGAECNAARDQAFETALIGLINSARSAQSLDSLTPQSQLTSAALEHSLDMACKNHVDHIGSDGSLWYDRVSQQGYANYNSARENIRVGNPDFGFTPQYVFDQWNISQVHHDAMFNPDVSEIGVACVFYPESEYVGYCTAVFARP